MVNHKMNIKDFQRKLISSDADEARVNSNQVNYGSPIKQGHGTPNNHSFPLDK
jgi:hypothetical protein